MTSRWPPPHSSLFRQVWASQQLQESLVAASQRTSQEAETSPDAQGSGCLGLSSASAGRSAVLWKPPSPRQCRGHLAGSGELSEEEEASIGARRGQPCNTPQRCWDRWWQSSLIHGTLSQRMKLVTPHPSASWELRWTGWAFGIFFASSAPHMPQDSLQATVPANLAQNPPSSEAQVCPLRAHSSHHTHSAT